MPRALVTLYIAGIFAALSVAPLQGHGQSLLSIPDLDMGTEPTVEPKGSSAKKCLPKDGRVPVRSMTADQSMCFWGEPRASLLPGSTVGLGTERGAIYTEIAHVLSGPWRIAVGSALAVASDDSEDDTDPADPAEPTEESSTGFGRFVAGGGSLSLQGLRPLFVANSSYNGVALFFAPRGWLNVPQLSSATGIGDYGGEVAGSLLLQRRDNTKKPFLALEFRGGFVVGSSDFYDTIGRTEHKSFVYLAPTLTFTIQEQVNFGVSAFISGAFEGEKTATLRLTLLNKTPAK